MRRLALFAGAVLLLNCSSDKTPSAPIVPLAPTPRAFPQVGYNGGYLLNRMRLVLITAGNDPLQDSLFQFANAVPGSNWWQQVSQAYQLTGAMTVRTVAGPSLPAGQVTTAQLIAYIHGIVDSTDLAPDGRSLYLLALPFADTIGHPSCGGFHNIFDSTDAWGVVSRCTATMALAALTLTASHEIAEAATDPEFTGWALRAANAMSFDDFNPFSDVDVGDYPTQEIGDLCEGTSLIEGGFHYQRIYSNAAAATGGDPCVPHLSDPYYNVWADRDWYVASKISAGQQYASDSVNFTLHAWSSAPTASWCAYAHPNKWSGALPTVTYLTGDSTTVCGRTGRLVNNGDDIQVHLAWPDGGQNNDWVIVTVHSVPVPAAQVAYGELVHAWAVGAYIY